MVTVVAKTTATEINNSTNNVRKSITHRRKSSFVVTMTVGETAKLLHKDASEVIKKLICLGVMATINQELDIDTILSACS